MLETPQHVQRTTQLTDRMDGRDHHGMRKRGRDDLEMFRVGDPHALVDENGTYAATTRFREIARLSDAVDLHEIEVVALDAQGAHEAQRQRVQAADVKDVALMRGQALKRVPFGRDRGRHVATPLLTSMAPHFLRLP